MKSILRLAASIALALVFLPASVLVASEPTVDSVDYSNPDAYLVIPETPGNAQSIAERASTLKGSDPQQMVMSLQWDQRLASRAGPPFENSKFELWAGARVARWSHRTRNGLSF